MDKYEAPPGVATMRENHRWGAPVAPETEARPTLLIAEALRRLHEAREDLAGKALEEAIAMAANAAAVAAKALLMLERKCRFNVDLADAVHQFLAAYATARPRYCQMLEALEAADLDESKNLSVEQAERLLLHAELIVTMVDRTILISTLQQANWEVDRLRFSTTNRSAPTAQRRQDAKLEGAVYLLSQVAAQVGATFDDDLLYIVERHASLHAVGIMIRTLIQEPKADLWALADELKVVPARFKRKSTTQVDPPAGPNP
ncbi:hypothetical protein [Tardiphaga sp. OK245]|uniref:hypothetical protein n=1 Tax=Tardiphaga sp. OK245 TaxID=1855306 RepID=UPI0008A75DED|nr:hypothetical protein [Tardiphaga sp. OK245]SEH87682.1 hypothetical protein SAMN05216367_2489 [Tardiphaga sp. OK245]